MRVRWPWWVSVLLAVVSYTGVKYGIPALFGSEALPEEFLKLVAPITAIGFLLLSAKQLYDIPPEEQEDTDDSPPAEEE